MTALLDFIQTHPFFAIIGMTAVIIVLRLLGIGKKLITWGAVLVMAGGSIYIAKTMG